MERVVGLEEANAATDKQTVLIIDEADKLFIDDLKKPLTNCKACIGFTATIPNHKQETCFEARWLKHLNFEIRSSFGFDDELKSVIC